MWEDFAPVATRRCGAPVSGLFFGAGTHAMPAKLRKILTTKRNTKLKRKDVRAAILEVMKLRKPKAPANKV
jgi:hypothetical protein